MEIGTILGPTAWRRVEQSDIDAFAEISRDQQWIHTDVERARAESPWGTTIAHGTLTLALIDGFRDELGAGGDGFQGARLGVHMGYDRERSPAGVGAAGGGSRGGRVGANMGYDAGGFPAPVPAGGEVRATMEIASVEPLDGGWHQVVQRFVVELRGGERPVCVADSVIRVLT